MSIYDDAEAARRSRERQAADVGKHLTRKQRKQRMFDAQLEAAKSDPNSKLDIQQLPRGPKWHKKTVKLQLEAELSRARATIRELEKQVALLQQGRDKAEFYDSPEWQRARYEALKRSNGRCELCGDSKATGAIIQVDHIKPRSTHPQLELEGSNLQALCRPCNMGKSNRDEIDWRKPELKVVRGV